MKKEYKAPSMEVIFVNCHGLLCTSPSPDPDVEQIDIDEDGEMPKQWD